MLTLLLVAAAHAASPTPVLVSAWQARNADAAGLAGLLEDYLARELAKDDVVSLVRIEDTPDFKDYSARVYMDGCPPGDAVGCTQILAQRGKAAYAVTGTVQSLPQGSRIEVNILDVNGARIAVSFQSDVKEGEDAVFAAGVAKVLDAVIRGDMGKEEDIRDTDEAPASTIDKDAVAAQLAELSQQLGEAQLSVEEGSRPIPTTEYTMEDLTARMQTEGSKPWERLHMTPGAYLRYKNSGLQLMEYRRRANGRQGQLLLRAGVAYANGPSQGEYFARVGIGDSLQTEDSYAYQTTTDGPSAGGAIEVAYGILPILDVGVAGGWSTGRFKIDADENPVDQPPEATIPIEFFAPQISLGARAQVSLLPIQIVHPCLGVGLDYTLGHGVNDYYEFPASFHTEFGSMNLLTANLMVGGEANLGKHVDLYVHVPLELLLAGGRAEVVETGTPGLVDTGNPTDASPVGFGIQAGLQIRLGGRDATKDVGIDDLDEP